MKTNLNLFLSNFLNKIKFKGADITIMTNQYGIERTSMSMTKNNGNIIFAD